MKSINKNVVNEIIINKSRFITKLIKINNEDEIKIKLDYIKKEYKDATHYCYAYITGNTKRFNDDGEPGGTAGMPILNVLENNNLTNILCVVIRYFGGIKLGAGGLVRAYTKAVTGALNNAKIINLTDGFSINLEFDYNKIKIIDNILKDIKINYKEYDENIIYEFLIGKDKFNEIKKELENNSINLKIIDNILVEITQ